MVIHIQFKNNMPNKYDSILIKTVFAFLDEY